MCDVFFCFLFTKCRLLEDAYVIRDPFSPSAGHLTIGGNCCLCSKNVCMAQVF